VIFFADNIASRSQLHAVAAQLDAAAEASPVKAPLLLMTDQEGGEVRRLPGAPVPSAKQIGASAHPVSAARAAGRAAAKNLLAAGLDVNLAPVLDVYRAAGNFIDEFGRSFGMDPAVVGRLGAAFLHAEQAAGVASTAKHFPGLGAATRSQDTDARPVTLRLSRHAIRTVDERPYASAIAAGVKLVMLSWARYPALSGQRPAGLSKAIVQGELRRRLGFKGVTITDALEAGALRGYGGTGARAVKAARAGMDLVLCASGDPAQGGAAVDALASAFKQGRLGATAFARAANRVLALRGVPDRGVAPTSS
jgi:beta-N-acetylhexosaminidase